MPPSWFVMSILSWGALMPAGYFETSVQVISIVMYTDMHIYMDSICTRIGYIHIYIYTAVHAIHIGNMYRSVYMHIHICIYTYIHVYIYTYMICIWLCHCHLWTQIVIDQKPAAMRHTGTWLITYSGILQGYCQIWCTIFCGCFISHSEVIDDMWGMYWTINNP